MGKSTPPQSPLAVLGVRDSVSECSFENYEKKMGVCDYWPCQPSPEVTSEKWMSRN